MQNIPIKFREIFWPAAVKMKTGIFTQKKIASKKNQIVQIGEWRAHL